LKALSPLRSASAVQKASLRSDGSYQAADSTGAGGIEEIVVSALDTGRAALRAAWPSGNSALPVRGAMEELKKL